MGLNEKCRRFRLDNKIRVRDIAHLSGYSEWAVYKFEEGTTFPLRILFAYIYYGFNMTKEDIWQHLKSYSN